MPLKEINQIIAHINMGCEFVIINDKDYRVTFVKVLDNYFYSNVVLFDFIN